jgi:DnaJ-domain-containing protein 1
MDNDINTLAKRHEMDAALVQLFSHTKDYVAKNINNKVLAFVNHIESELNISKKELAAFKKNNEELIHRCNAAIASWDEERERALREADRVKEWKEKYYDLETYIRFIGKQIPCNTGGTFENDPIDAILDAALRALNDRKPERVDQLDSILDAVTTSWKEEKETMEKCMNDTHDSFVYVIERTKVFEALAEMLYKAEYDNTDGIKKIYEAVREKYPVGTYYPPCKKE